jgi:hypothetical protein
MKQPGVFPRKTAKRPDMDPTIPSALRPFFTRASDAGLKTEPYHSSQNPKVFQEENPVDGLLIYLPNGKDTRPFLIKYDERLEEHTNILFEQLQYISGYEAIWSKPDDVLEAELQGDEITYNNAFLLKRLKHIFRPVEDIDINEFNVLSILYRRKQVQVEFDESSSAFNLLSAYTAQRPKLVVRFLGIGASCHDEARNALQHIAEPLLFQIKREYNIHLRLRNARGSFSEIRSWSFLDGMLTLGS